MIYVQLISYFDIRCIAVGTREADELCANRWETTTARNLDLSALGIELLLCISKYERDVAIASTYSGHRVKRNRLESDQIVTGWDGRWNSCRPRGVIGNHLARTP